jgi:hypothetical protein
VLRELYRTNDLLRPFRTAENIQKLAFWPELLEENGIPVNREYHSERALINDVPGSSNLVPTIPTILRALGALHQKGLIMADKDLHQVALTEAGRVVIDQLPSEQRPQQAQLVVCGGFRERD